MFKTASQSLYKNVRNDPRILVAQWIERPPGVRKVVGLNPVMGSEFFLSIIDLKRRHCIAVVIHLSFFTYLKSIAEVLSF